MKQCDFCGSSDGALKGDDDLAFYYHKKCLDAAWSAEYGDMTNAEVIVAEGFEELLDPATVAAVKADTARVLQF